MIRRPPRSTRTDTLFPYTTLFRSTASVAWTPDIGSNGLSALFYIDGRMTSDYNTGSDLFPEKEQDGFNVVNARIGLRSPDQRRSIAFWGQTIFHQDYPHVAFRKLGRAACRERVSECE